MRLSPLLATIILICFAITPAIAQDWRPLVPKSPTIYSGPMVKGEVVDEPICFTVHNRAPYSVFGTVSTDKYQTPEGVTAHHRSNFRLKTGEFTEFCSKGPFYEGRRLEFKLRSLVPLFSCKTKIDAPIIIQGRHKPEGGTESWASCS